MMKKYLIGVDIGTNETKGCCCDIFGNVKAVTKRSHHLIIPAPGFAEHSPSKQWWPEFVSIINELIMTAGISNQEIAAVGISSVMAAITFLDENLKPLRNAILYGIDSRSVKQADELNQLIGVDRLLQVCGSKCTTESFGPKINWVKENEPEIYAKTKHITFASGFLTSQLTGKFGVDRYSATSAIPMIDNTKMQWDSEMCSYVCPISLLPEIMETTDIVGYVTKDAAKLTGLAESTPVICGTTDAGAEAVSAGVLTPGDTMLMYGSTAFMLHVTDESSGSEKLWRSPYVLSPYTAVCAGTSTAGAVTTWLKQVIGKDLISLEEQAKGNAFDLLFSEANNIPLGSDGVMVLPYFLGQRMPDPNPDATGVIFGLKMHHGRGHIVHATFEGVGYNIAQLFSLLGNNFQDSAKVRAIGGGTKNPLWLQIVSDICGISQTVPAVKVGAAYGDALLAGFGIGVIKDINAIKSMIKTGYIVEPNYNNYEKYQKYFEINKQLYTSTVTLMSELKNTVQGNLT